MGAPEDAVAAAQRMYEAGVLVGCFRPPSVPDGISRLRLTARAGVGLEAAAAAARLAARAVTDASPVAGGTTPQTVARGSAVASVAAIASAR